MVDLEFGIIAMASYNINRPFRISFIAEFLRDSCVFSYNFSSNNIMTQVRWPFMLEQPYTAC